MATQLTWSLRPFLGESGVFTLLGGPGNMLTHFASHVVGVIH